MSLRAKAGPTNGQRALRCCIPSTHKYTLSRNSDARSGNLGGVICNVFTASSPAATTYPRPVAEAPVPQVVDPAVADPPTQPSPPFSAANVVLRFIDALNHRDLSGMLLLLADDCHHEDLSHEGTANSKEEVARFYTDLVASMPERVRVVVDDITAGDDTKAGVMWHMEVDGVEVPCSRGLSFYRVRTLHHHTGAHHHHKGHHHHHHRHQGPSNNHHNHHQGSHHSLYQNGHHHHHHHHSGSLPANAGLGAGGLITYVRQSPEHFVKMSGMVLSATASATPLIDSLGPMALPSFWSNLARGATNMLASAPPVEDLLMSLAAAGAANTVPSVPGLFGSSSGGGGGSMTHNNSGGGGGPSVGAGGAGWGAGAGLSPGPGWAAGSVAGAAAFSAMPASTAGVVGSGFPETRSAYIPGFQGPGPAAASVSPHITTATATTSAASTSPRPGTVALVSADAESYGLSSPPHTAPIVFAAAVTAEAPPLTHPSAAFVTASGASPPPSSPVASQPAAAAAAVVDASAGLVVTTFPNASAAAAAAFAADPQTSASCLEAAAEGAATAAAATATGVPDPRYPEEYNLASLAAHSLLFRGPGPRPATAVHASGPDAGAAAQLAQRASPDASQGGLREPVVPDQLSSSSSFGSSVVAAAGAAGAAVADPLTGILEEGEGAAEVYGASSPQLRSLGGAAGPPAMGPAAAAPSLPFERLAGIWEKDLVASDVGGYERALDLWQISGVQKATARLIEGLELVAVRGGGGNSGSFQVHFLTIIPYFKVTESYPMGGGRSRMRRRDLRSGDAQASAEAIFNGVRCRASWGAPYAGELEESYVLVADPSGQPDVLHVTSTIRVGGREATTLQVYNRRRNMSARDLISASERRNGKANDVLRRFGMA